MSRDEVMGGAAAWSYPGHGPNAEVGVVVVHGFLGNPTSTRPLGGALGEAGYAVEVPRLPGHGTSWRDLAGTRYPDWRRAAEDVFDELRSRCRKVVLVGLSMGGTIVLDVTAGRCRAGRASDVAGLVTINALVLDREELVAKLAPVLRFVLPVVTTSQAGVQTNDIAKGGDEKAYSFVPSHAGYSLARELPRIRLALGDIAVPALVIHSAQDHTVDPRNAAAIVERLGSSDVAEHVLERSYHVATLDYEAEQLSAAIREFVARVTRP
ncbi:MAG: alpha/beta fold hydrolase [Actinomycetota bacterium]|nr:alpha/beta fold hydrolase [Actinomycetota bacterium]